MATNTLESLASSIPKERRPQAKESLDAIDRASLSADEFGELSRAYVLLGFFDAASSAGAGLPPNDPRRAWGLSQAAAAAAGRSDYEEAVRLANEALRVNPADPVAHTTLRLAQGRGQASSASATGPQTGMAAASNPARPSSDGPPLVMSAPTKRRPLSESAIPSMQMLDDETAAPEATLTDRAMALVMPHRQLVEQDLKTMRRLLVGFEMPHDTISLASANLDAPKQFISWIKSAPDSELAPISYGIIEPGLLGEYRPRVLAKGKVRLNHFIRGVEPETRATVLLHEIYHYWDVEVAGNPYSEPYNYKSPEAMARREYDAYAVARDFWRHARPGDASSAASKALDRIPDDPQELMRRVDELVLRRKDNR